MDETAILAHAQQNPLYAAILIENYRTFEETTAAAKQAILICLSQMDDIQTIKIKHFLFAAIFMFEKATDCTAADPRHMDCIFLKTILDALKEGGFYQAYLKFTSGMQIGHQMHSLYARRTRGGGRARARPSLMYFVIIILSMLANAGAIQINNANKYARQIVQDFRIYTSEYDMKTSDPQTYFNLYFSKLATYYNQYGSCVYQSLVLGASPKHISNLHDAYKKHATTETKMPAFDTDTGINLIDLISIPINNFDDALYKAKEHGNRIFTVLNTTYHDASIIGNDMGYLEQFVTKEYYNKMNHHLLLHRDTSDNYKRIVENHRTTVINAELAAIKAKLHLPELMGENLFDTSSSESIIITIPTTIIGHMFINYIKNGKNILFFI